MTNFDIFKNLEFLVRKEKEGGTLSPDEFNRLLKLANIEMQNISFPTYEVTQDVKDALLPFVVSEIVSQTSFTINLTDDLSESYSKLVGSPYYNDGTYNRDIEVVTDAEWTQRVTSALVYPLASHPICRLYSDNTGDKILKILPIEDKNIEITYLKDPIEPSLTLTLDGNDQLAQSASVELEWDDTEKVKIMYIMAQKLGINLNEQDLLQYSSVKQSE